MNAGDLLQELIRIPSVNPESSDGASSPAELGEARIADHLTGLLSGLGAVTHLETPAASPGRPNLVAEFPSDVPGKPRILLGPHTDTVGVAGMTIDPFGGELRDGRIWGRGASDTKGTMASMIAALARLGAKEIAKLSCEVHFVAFCAEETAQHGSRDFARRHAGEYRFALVGEPTNCKVVHVHKGCTWATLSVPGKAVHGSIPEQGINAITRMGRLLHAIDHEFRSELADAGGVHPDLGESTINIGTIGGGSRTNIVPDLCSVTLDLRTTPHLEKCSGGYDLLRAFVKRHDVDAELEIIGDPAPCLDTPSDDPFVVALGAAGEGLTGAPWFCDAARLANEGAIPSVAAGPGSIEQAHTSDEFLCVSDLEEGVDFYEAFLRSLPSL